MKIMVVHQGKRDEYQVAIALLDGGHDVTLVTSAYPNNFVVKTSKLIPWFRPLKKLANRDHQELIGIEIFGGLFEELYGKVLGKLFGEALGQEYVDRGVTARALKIARSRSFDAIVCYSYNAYDLFSVDDLKHVKKVLFQCHPHPILIRSIVELHSKDGSFPVDNREREFAYSKIYLAKLISECYFADRIICASSFTAESLRKVGISDDLMRVIPYGRSEKYSINKIRTFAGGSPLRVIFVGQFVFRKGIAVIWKILNQITAPIDITFVGRGLNEVDPLSGIDNPLVTSRTYWDVSQERLVELYSASAVFLFPSYIEGFAHVILEAMSMGCIPLVSRSSCGPDIIDFDLDGYYFDAQEVSSYVEKLCGLAKSANLDSMRAACVIKGEQYTWKKFKIEVEKAVAN